MVAVVVMPLLLTFLFAAIDLGRVAFLGAEASTAAHAVCRCAEANPAAAASPDRLREAAVEASPSLGAADLELFVSVEMGDAVEREIAYRLHDDENGLFLSRSVCTRTRPIASTLTVHGRYLTPIGALLSQGAGSAAFSCVAEARGSIDETAEGEGA